MRQRILDLCSIGISMAALGASRLAFNLVGNRFLGLEIVGEANVCLSLSLLVGLPTSAGLAAAVSRFLPLSINDSEAIRTLRLVCRVAAATIAIGLLGLWALVSLTGSSFVAPSKLVVVGAWSALYAGYALGRAHLYAEARIRRALVLEILALILFAAALGAACARPELWWLPFGVYPAPVLTHLLIRLLHLAHQGEITRRREFLHFAGLGFLGSAASLGTQYVSTIVAAALGGSVQAGRWATLTSLAAPVLLLPRSLGTLYLPRLSALSVDPSGAFERTAAEHRRVARRLAVAAVGPPLLLGVAAMPLFLGSAADGITLRSWVVLSLSTYLMCRLEPVMTALAARGHAGVNAAAALTAAALCCLAWLGGMPLLGVLLGLAAASLVQTISTPFFAVRFARAQTPGYAAGFRITSGDVAVVGAASCLFLGPNEVRLIWPAAALLAIAIAVEFRKFVRSRIARPTQ